MDFNFISNVKACFDLLQSTVNIPLIYYSHLPVTIISPIIGLYVFLKNKTLLGKALFLIAITFSIWSIADLVAWTTNSGVLLIFAWSFYGILTTSIFVLSAYFSYIFSEGKDISVGWKFFVIIICSPIIILTPTILAISSFNSTWCIAEESIYFQVYYYLICGLFFLLTFIQGMKTIFNKKTIISRNESLLFYFGLLLFLLAFGFTSFIASYLTEIGLSPTFYFEPYGLFGMVIFLGFLAYIIVRFKAFNIKLLGPQVLVWALIFLVGSQFFYVDFSTTIIILTSSTLVISSVIGLLLIRSVKKEDEQKEQLEIANQNQQLLIRFITHQVKGFFTKSKMVFASILEGDVGEVSEPVKNLMKDGLESDNKAVDMVQEVLKASSLRSGTMTYSFEKINLAEFIQGIGETFRDTAVAKNLEYQINLPTEAAEANIDKLQMTQVIKNLIDNSVKYTLTGFVHVNLKIKTIKDRKNTIKSALFSVEDSGVGLSDGDKAKLFKEGGRGEESLKVNVNSTGYGLFIVKKIVEGHKGSIWAESRGRGHGTKFFVEIPLVNSSLK